MACESRPLLFHSRLLWPRFPSHSQISATLYHDAQHSITIIGQCVSRGAPTDKQMRISGNTNSPDQGVFSRHYPACPWRPGLAGNPVAMAGPGVDRDHAPGIGFLAPLAFVIIRIIAIVVTVVPNAPWISQQGCSSGPSGGPSIPYGLGGWGHCLLSSRTRPGEGCDHPSPPQDITFSDRIARRELTYIVLFARLEPVFSFSLVSYGAGLTSMSLTAFALSTLVGMTPGTILLNYYGRVFSPAIS